MRLSIIVPIFNTALFLNRCIESCLNQDISDLEYEIILINDGSTDDSAKICKYFRDNYSNIKYLEQLNSGQSIARNNGLKIAVGDYIWFIDSDDWILEKSLGILLKNCDHYNLDILRIGYKKIENNDIILNECESYDKIIEVFSNKNYIKKEFVFGAPLYIFKRNFLINNQLYFTPGIFHEDNEFTPRAIYYASVIGSTKSIFYYYYSRNGSTTKSVNPKKCFDLLIVCDNLINFTKKIEKEIQPFINNIISTSFNTALSYALEIDYKSKENFTKQLISKKEVLYHMRKSNKVKFIIEGYIFNLFPRYILFIYKLTKKQLIKFI